MQINREIKNFSDYIRSRRAESEANDPQNRDTPLRAEAASPVEPENPPPAIETTARQEKQASPSRPEAKLMAFLSTFAENVTALVKKEEKPQAGTYSRDALVRFYEMVKEKRDSRNVESALTKESRAQLIRENSKREAEIRARAEEQEKREETNRLAERKLNEKKYVASNRKSVKENLIGLLVGFDEGFYGYGFHGAGASLLEYKTYFYKTDKIKKVGPVEPVAPISDRGRSLFYPLEEEFDYPPLSGKRIRQGFDSVVKSLGEFILRNRINRRARNPPLAG